MYTKINKTKARKMHAEGKQVFCLPCNVRPGNMWVGMGEVPLDRDFDKFCNEFKYYNCQTSYLGKEIAWYISDGNQN